MMKTRKPHPIVQVVQDTACELNDLLNAVGLRIALLRHQLEASSAEAEMIRLAGLIDKAAQRVRRLEDYTRAEELVESDATAQRQQENSRARRPIAPRFCPSRAPRLHC